MSFCANSLLQQIVSLTHRLLILVASKLKLDFEAFYPDPGRNTEEKKFRLNAFYSFIFCPANAPVEMGFSINENMLEENMVKESIGNRKYIILTFIFSLCLISNPLICLRE